MMISSNKLSRVLFGDDVNHEESDDDNIENIENMNDNNNNNVENELSCFQKDWMKKKDSMSDNEMNDDEDLVGHEDIVATSSSDPLLDFGSSSCGQVYDELLVCSPIGSELSHTLINSSPNYLRRVRALKLLESPQTPKTLLRSAANDCQQFVLSLSPKCAPNHKRGSRSLFASTVKKQPNDAKDTRLKVNVNPFTPTGMLLQQNHFKKRKSSSFLAGYVHMSCHLHVFMSCLLHVLMSSVCPHVMSSAYLYLHDS